MSDAISTTPHTMKSMFRPFPLPLTGKQKFYLGVLQGLGAGIIDGGANFGIAYAMYHAQSVVKMWIFSQNTIAGDLGVTPLIQCGVSMLISSSLVHTDLHNHAIQPLAFCYPHVEHLPDPRTLGEKVKDEVTGEKQKITEEQVHRQHSGLGANSTNGTNGMEEMTIRHEGDTDETTVIGSDGSTVIKGYGPYGQWKSKSFSYYYWMLMRFIFEGTEKNMIFAKPGAGVWFGRLGYTALQGVCIGIVFGFPLWCLFIVILGPIFKMDNMGGTWSPQIIKGVYGAVLGWITNPVIAVLALGSQAEQSLIIVEQDEEGDVGLVGDAETPAGREQSENDQEDGGEGAGVETIREGEVSVFSRRAQGANTGRTSPSASLRPIPPSHTNSTYTANVPIPTPGLTPTSAEMTAGSSNRSRASSNASYRSRSSSNRSRPPLTADVSYIYPISIQSLSDPSQPPSSTFLAPPITSTSLSSSQSRERSNSHAPQPSLSSPRISRVRGATVSHTIINPPMLFTRPSIIPQFSSTGSTMGTSPMITASPNGSNKTYCYALGGTGGRAQRSRSRSSSLMSQIPTLKVSPDVDQHGRTPEVDSAAVGGMGGGDGSPTRPRTASSQQPPSSWSNRNTGYKRSSSAGNLTSAGQGQSAGGRTTPVWDVFGRTGTISAQAVKEESEVKGGDASK